MAVNPARKSSDDDELPPPPGSPDNPDVPPAPGYPGYQGGQKPPQRQEAYINSPAERSHDMWGKNDYWLDQAEDQKGQGMMPGPYMPQPSDIGSVIFGIAAGVGNWGSRNVAMPGIAMGTYAASFLENLRDGNKERAANDYQQYRQSRQMMKDRMEDEVQDGAEAFALYRDKPKQLDEALHNIARKYHWDALTNALATRGPAAAEKLFQALDSKWVDTKKMEYQEQQRKQLDEERRLRIKEMQERERDREEKRKALERERKQWDPSLTGPGPGAAGTPETGPGASDSSGEESEPGASAEPATPPTRFAEAGTTMTDAGPQGQARPITPSARPGDQDLRGSRYDAGISSSAEPSAPPETPAIERAAQDWFQSSHKLPPSVKNLPDIAARIETRGGKIENELDRIASDPRIKPNDVIPEVRKLLPGFAARLDSYLAGDTPPPKSFGTNTDYWNTVFALGHKIDPNFTPDTFAERARAHIYWTSGDGGKTLTSNGMFLKHSDELLQILHDKPYPFTGWISKYTPFGSPEVSDIENLVNTVNTEYARALAGKGATIPELKEQASELSMNMTEAAIKANLNSKRRAIRDRIDTLKDQYTSATGLPGKDILDRFERYSRTDPSATNADRTAAQKLHEIDARDGNGVQKPANGSGAQGAKEGDRKQFKQGWGVFRNGKWIPE